MIEPAKPADFKALQCSECLKGNDLGFEFHMAFQPIVNTNTGSVLAQEALVRGPENQGAGWVFERINDSNRYRFDQACRVKAIQQASLLGETRYLISIFYRMRCTDQSSVSERLWLQRKNLISHLIGWCLKLQKVKSCQIIIIYKILWITISL